jgi:FtsH-binding integral membrane protein
MNGERQQRALPNPTQWLNLDAIGIVVFALIGRDRHADDRSLGAALGTAAPFLIAVFVGWFVAKAWRNPASMRAGLITWATTLIVGMVLRRVLWDRGTAWTFVVVAAVFLALTMLSWRYVLGSIQKRMGAPPPTDRD